MILTLLLPELAPTGALVNQHGQAYDLEVHAQWNCRDIADATAVAEQYVNDLADRQLTESDRYKLANGGTITLTQGAVLEVHYPESDWPSNRDAHDEATYGRMFEPWHERRAA